MLALAGSLGLLVAGCGSAVPASKGHAPSKAIAATAVASAASTPSATRVALAPARPVVAVKTAHTVYGNVLVDGKGRALYLFTRDGTPQSQCYAECATRWPPFLATSKPIAGAGAHARLLGTTRRRGAANQVTYRGHPLYYYIGDHRPGDVLCEDVEEFGGRWYVVNPTGSAVL